MHVQETGWAPKSTLVLCFSCRRYLLRKSPWHSLILFLSHSHRTVADMDWLINPYCTCSKLGWAEMLCSWADTCWPVGIGSKFGFLGISGIGGPKPDLPVIILGTVGCYPKQCLCFSGSGSGFGFRVILPSPRYSHIANQTISSISQIQFYL